MNIPFHTTDGTIDLGKLVTADFTTSRIARSLAKINRFNGRTPEPWSVAAHSVMVSRLCDPADSAWGLLHDAHEAFLGDITTPALALIATGHEAGSRGWIHSAVSETKRTLDYEIGRAWTAMPRAIAPSVIRADRLALDAEMLCFFNVAPKLNGELERSLFDRATDFINSFPIRSNWRVARDCWADEAHKLASQGLLRPPTEV